MISYNSPNNNASTYVSSDQKIIFQIRFNTTNSLSVLNVALNSIAICVDYQKFSICKSAEGNVMPIIYQL